VWEGVRLSGLRHTSLRLYGPCIFASSEAGSRLKFQDGDVVDRSRCPIHRLTIQKALPVHPECVPERGVQLDPDVEFVEFLLDSRDSNIVT
jgi:hypothetical protein